MRIIGHRGARGEAPENTLAGFQYLHNLGIRAVEFDVRQLNDQSLVVMHDDNFIRTTGISKELYACSRADLSTYNQASVWLDWEHQITPLLQQSLAMMSQFEHIEVEVKAVTSMAEAQRLVLTLEQQLQGFEHNVVITSFDSKIHEALQQQASIFRRGLLIEDSNLAKPIQLALEYGCSQIGWMDRLATDATIAATQEAGLEISVWTVNDKKRAQHLRSLGVQGLITDFPQMMQQLFQSNETLDS